MPAFVCEALDSQGQEVRAEIEARTAAEVDAQLRARDWVPIRILPRPAVVLSAPQSVARTKSWSFAWRVKQSELTEVTRQLATLLDAGLPLVKSLDIVHRQLQPGLLKSALEQVKEDVEGGSSLSEALARQSRVFDKLYVNMVKAGEAGGVLDEILSRLADYREKAQKLQQKIIGALMYPAAVIIIAAGILIFIMVFIIPRFELMFAEMNVQLPIVTTVLMAIAHAMATFWYVLLFLPLLAYLLFKVTVRTPPGRLLVDRIKLGFPVFGLIVLKSSVSRFCRTFGTLVQSGVPILEALSIIKNATGNQVLANAVDAVHSAIKQGDTISEPLAASGVFDDMVVNMIHVGEETGQLDKMLIKIADTYDAGVDTLVGALMSLLEPVLIVGMGTVVGFIVVALFLPMLTMMQNL